jgi:predicted protein tyrosine phosphatase
MFARLKAEFSRYFFMTAPANSYARTIYETFGLYSKSREVASAIIEGRVYLTNLPLNSPFTRTSLNELPENENSALVVSCIDLGELAASPLLHEPDAPKIKYHVLAMQDATAVVGSIDQIFETLQLMSSFADQKKPILIHCYSGVGRSAMMTAIHIAHRYLLGDELVKTLIDEKAKLDVSSSHYIKELYEAVSKLFVLSKRDCCQFDAALRNELAAKVLTELHTQIQAGQLNIIARDDDYQFLSAFVQTPACKALQHYFYHSLLSQHSYVPAIVPVLVAQLGASKSAPEALDPKKMLQKFFDDFLLNEDGWYQQLLDVVRNEKSDRVDSRAPNALEQFCNVTSNAAEEEKQNVQSDERRQYLNGILDVMIELATKFPNSGYSQQILASLQLQVVADQQPLSPKPFN